MTNGSYFTEEMKATLVTAYERFQEANRINRKALEINERTVQRMAKLIARFYRSDLLRIEPDKTCLSVHSDIQFGFVDFEDRTIKVVKS